MEVKNPCVIFIGSSGAGKSTVMQKCLEEKWPNGWQVEKLHKITSRPSHDPLGDHEEFRTTNELREMYATELLGVLTEKFGHLYAVPKISMLHTPRTLYVQCMPTDTIRLLRESGEYAVYGCLFEISPEVARTRVLSRQREVSEPELAARLVAGQAPRLYQAADKVVSAEREIEAVFADVRDWMISLMSTSEGK